MVSAAHNKVFFSRFFFCVFFSYYQKRQHIKFFFLTFMLYTRKVLFFLKIHTQKERKKIENNIKLCNFIMLNFHPTFPYLMVFLFFSTLYLLISIPSEGFFLVKIILILTFRMGKNH